MPTEINDYILEELRTGFKEIHARVDSLKDQMSAASLTSAEAHVRLPRLEADVERLVKTVHLGNGSPPIVVQLSEIKSSIEDIDNRLEEARQKRELLISTVQELSMVLDRKAVSTDLSDREIKRLKWSAYGKVAAAIGLAIPGILAFVASIL